MRAMITTALGLAAALALAPSASAHGVITAQGSVLTYTATNTCLPVPCPSTLLVTTPETGVLEFEDNTSNGGIFWGPCTPVTEQRARCDSGGVTRLDLVFDANDDSATAATVVPLHVAGGEGNDRLGGGYGADLLEGGPGSDSIVAGAGADTVSGDAGDDSIDLRDGFADSVTCGDGIDAVFADLSDPPDLSAAGCEIVTFEDTPPAAGPPDTPPDTTIKRSPARRTDREAARFKFKATEAGSSYECSRDASPYRPCRSPKRYGGLPGGRHLFKVRATDSAGHTDPTPAVFHWRVVR